MTEFSVCFRVINTRNCPFYEEDERFTLTAQAVQIPDGHPSCLILVRAFTGLVAELVPGAENNFAEEREKIYTCGGCTGLIKFQIGDVSDGQEQGFPLSPREHAADAHRESGRELERKGGSVISGFLEEISPSELLQFFHMHQKIGKLLLHVPSGVGRIAFREGGIIGAKFGDMENKEAIFALLGEHQGRFSFASGIPPSLEQVEEIADFMMLLMEGIKRLDEDKGEGGSTP